VRKEGVEGMELKREKEREEEGKENVI